MLVSGKKQEGRKEGRKRGQKSLRRGGYKKHKTAGRTVGRVEDWTELSKDGKKKNRK